jgi:hypothetical protein
MSEDPMLQLLQSARVERIGKILVGSVELLIE